MEKCMNCDGEPMYCEACAMMPDPEAERQFELSLKQEVESLAGMIRAWADRQRLLHNLPQETVADFERCAEDIAQGFGRG